MSQKTTCVISLIFTIFSTVSGRAATALCIEQWSRHIAISVMFLLCHLKVSGGYEREFFETVTQLVSA